jgi:hypothetical protein
MTRIMIRIIPMLIWSCAFFATHWVVWELNAPWYVRATALIPFGYYLHGIWRVDG